MTDVPYISWIRHGATNLSAPDTFTDATMSLFSIETDATAVQNLVDALLNPAAGGRVRYSPALSVAIFSFSDAARCTSKVDAIGFMPGRETMILVPLWEFHGINPLPSRLVFWAPYIFIDYTIGLVTGREVWGWPKAFARIGVDTDAPGADFSCRTTVFPVFAPTTPAQDVILYRIFKTQESAETQPWESARQAAHGAVRGLLDGMAEDALQLLVLQPQIPCVVLKQFRTSDVPTLCCYQAIVNSPIAVTNFGGGGPLFDSFTAEIATCESHRIVFDLLGTMPTSPTTRLPIKFAARAKIDYAALPGSAVIVAT
jgi:hypothetical protein